MIKFLNITPLPKGLFRVEYLQNKAKQEIIFHQETVFKHRLNKEETMSLKDFKKLQNEDAIHQTYAYAIHKLAYKNYTEQSMRKTLKTLSISSATLNQVLDTLKEQHYINDSKYFEQIVNEMLEYDTKGPHAMKQKLLKEGFQEHLIEDYLATISDKLWEEKCQHYITALLKARKNESKQARNQYLKTKCYQQGFSLDIINKLIDDLRYDNDEDAILKEKIAKYVRRYNINDAKEKHRLIQKLLREGFTYHQIKNHLK